MDYQTFKKNIEYLTGETKQNKIADILHVSTSKISKWFTGELLPTLTDILNISEKYHCSIDWLIGNQYEDESKLSVYDICKLLVKLDNKHLFISMELKETIEEVSFWDSENQDYVRKKYKNTLPMIYVHNTLSIDDIFDKMDYQQYWFGNYDEFEYSIYRNHGTYLEANQEINAFLTKYIQIKSVLYKDLISEDIFNEIVDTYLNKLSKKTIDYFPFIDRSGENISFDDIPFDYDESDRIADLKLMEEVSRIENQLSVFVEKTGVKFIDSDEQKNDSEK